MAACWYGSKRAHANLQSSISLETIGSSLEPMDGSLRTGCPGHSVELPLHRAPVERSSNPRSPSGAVARTCTLLGTNPDIPCLRIESGSRSSRCAFSPKRSSFVPIGPASTDLAWSPAWSPWLRSRFVPAMAKAR